MEGEVPRSAGQKTRDSVQLFRLVKVEGSAGGHRLVPDTVPHLSHDSLRNHKVIDSLGSDLEKPWIPFA